MDSSICLAKFSAHPGTTFCLVGVAKDYRLKPRRVDCGYIYTYRLHKSSTGQGTYLAMELVHKTTLDEIPYAMCPFQGKVLIGVGRMLRLYDLGKKKLLRKCENKARTLKFSAFLLNDLNSRCLFLK